MKKYLAEFIGTAALVLLGCGSAVTSNQLLGADTAANSPFGFSTLTIAFAFGLSLMAMCYVIGPISGCHINPAVSLGMLLADRMSLEDFAFYLVAQIAGGVVGAGLLWAMLGSNSNLGQNAYSTQNFSGSPMGVNSLQAVMVETVLTFIFVFTVIAVTEKKEFKSISGIVCGLTLTLVHIFGIPFTGTSVNPARSFGPAMLAGRTAISQVWVFIVGPLLGGALASLAYMALTTDKTGASTAQDARQEQQEPEG